MVEIEFEKAKCTKSPRVLLKVTVEVFPENSDTILVHEGDDPHDLAIAFCAKHSLQKTLIEPLAAHIGENLKKVIGDGCETQNKKSASQSESGHREKEAKKPTPKPLPKKSDRSQSRTPVKCASTTRSSGKPVERTPSYARTPRLSYAGTSAGSSRPNSARQSRGRASVKEACGSSSNSRASTPGCSSQPRRQVGAAPRTSDLAQVPVAGPRHEHIGQTPVMQDGGNRFERLYDEASQRQSRLERLRRQVEQDIIEQRSRTSPQAGILTPRRVLGDRLYRDAQERQEKIKELQTKTLEKRLHEELVGVTFSPSITASQRTWHGVGRSLRDPEGIKTKEKINTMRQAKEDKSLYGCTFHPTIDPKSEQLMSQRISRLKIRGSLYEHLYEDAQRRQERRVEYDRSLPPGVTFQPDIGDNPRPPNDDNREDFVHRLAYSKSYSERWLSMRRQQEGEEGAQGGSSNLEFHPQTGRGPIVERNKNGLPIGEFLYEHGKERSLRSQVEAEVAERERAQSSAPKVGEASRQLFEESKNRMYRELYCQLTSSDPEKRLRYETLSLDGLDEELVEFLRPMTVYLKETDADIDFHAFAAALDYQRQHSAVPTAHLFAPRMRSRSASRRQETDGDGFRPHIDPKSNRIAARHRPRGAAPLHEQLLREKEVWQSKLVEQRVLEEERILQECTFQPNAIGRIGSSERILKADLQTPRSLSDASQGRHASRFGDVLLSTEKSPLTTPRGGRNANNPVTQIIHSLASARDTAFMEGVFQTIAPDVVTFDTCQKQIEEAERTVAQCKTLLHAYT